MSNGTSVPMRPASSLAAAAFVQQQQHQATMSGLNVDLPGAPSANNATNGTMSLSVSRALPTTMQQAQHQFVAAQQPGGPGGASGSSFPPQQQRQLQQTQASAQPTAGPSSSAQQPQLAPQPSLILDPHHRAFMIQQYQQRQAAQVDQHLANLSVELLERHRAQISSQRLDLEQKMKTLAVTPANAANGQEIEKKIAQTRTEFARATAMEHKINEHINARQK
jgi:hypothetical protein